MLARTRPTTHPAVHHSPKPKSLREEEGLACGGEEKLPRVPSGSLRPGSHGRRRGERGEDHDNMQNRTYKATGNQRPHKILLKHSHQSCEEAPLLLRVTHSQRASESGCTRSTPCQAVIYQQHTTRQHSSHTQNVLPGALVKGTLSKHHHGGNFSNPHQPYRPCVS